MGALGHSCPIFHPISSGTRWPRAATRGLSFWFPKKELVFIARLLPFWYNKRGDVMTKYEQTLALFGKECTISAQSGLVKIILVLEKNMSYSKWFSNDGTAMPPDALVNYLHGCTSTSMKIAPTQWEFSLDFRSVDNSTGASIRPTVESQEMPLEEFLKAFPPKPDGFFFKPGMDLNNPADVEKELGRFFEWMELENKKRKRVNLSSVQTWEKLKRPMEIVMKNVAGVWEVTPLDNAEDTAFYSWELDLRDVESRTQTVRIQGETLKALVSAIGIADTTTLQFTSRENSSLTEFLIGIDEPFS